MNDDRELLELAAKAAGIPRNQWDYEGMRQLGHMVTRNMMWNPLNSNADAFALMMLLEMSVDVDSYETSSYAYAGEVPRVWAMEIWRGDKEQATRRAIVRAAAEIGKGVV